MTSTLLAALKALSVVRVGYVVRDENGKPMERGGTHVAPEGGAAEEAMRESVSSSEVSLQ